MEASSKVAVIFDNTHRGFRIITKLKKLGYAVKSFKPTNFLVSEARDADFVLVDVNPQNHHFTDVLKDADDLGKPVFTLLKKEFDHLISGFSHVKRLNRLNELNKLSSVPSLEFDFPILSSKDFEDLVKDGTDVLLFRFEKFDSNAIVDIADILNEIYMNLKRSDKFYVIVNMGFAIVPYNQGDRLGLEALREKINEFLLKSEKDIKNLNFLNSYILKNASDFEQLHVNSEDTGKKINIVYENTASEKASIDESILDSIDSNSLFVATRLLSNEDFAYLWFDEKIRRYIDPFMKIGSARVISRIKGNVNAKRIDLAKDEFFKRLSEIVTIADKVSKESFLNNISEDSQLMSLPEIQSNIIMLINEDAPFNRIVREIEKDPAITSKILKFANSAFYGLKSKIKSIQRAAVVLGTEELLAISLSISYLSMSNSIFTKRLYKYAIATLAIAKFIESLADIATGVTLAAVVHVIGDMFYAQHFSENYKELIKKVGDSGQYETAQIGVLPVPTEELGAYLAQRWNFPERAVKVIRCYLYPKLGGMDTTVHLVHAASILAKGLGYFLAVTQKKI